MKLRPDNVTATIGHVVEDVPFPFHTCHLDSIRHPWLLKLVRRLMGLGEGCYIILLNNFEESKTWKVIGPISDLIKTVTAGYVIQNTLRDAISDGEETEI